MTFLSATDVRTAVTAAAALVPDLQVVIADNCPHPYGIDPVRGIVYTDGSLTPNDWATATLAGLDALCRHLGHHAPPRLRLVPPPRRDTDDTDDIGDRAGGRRG